MEHGEFHRRQELCNLRAMRYLPPGTRLPRPATYEERLLLADLVALPDDADPRSWLRRERGALVTRIALRETLMYLQELRRHGLDRVWPRSRRGAHGCRVGEG